MKREIKFRCFCDEENKMFQVKGIDFTIPFSKSIMQFTGLKDKNGVEIFEGDYFKIDGVICEVVWLDDGFKLVGEGFNADALYPQCRDGIWGEVIGNVWETPELL